MTAAGADYTRPYKWCSAPGGGDCVLRLFSDPWRSSHRPVGELLKKRKLAGCGGASSKGKYFEGSCGGSPPLSSHSLQCCALRYIEICRTTPPYYPALGSMAEWFCISQCISMHNTGDYVNSVGVSHHRSLRSTCLCSTRLHNLPACAFSTARPPGGG